MILQITELEYNIFFVLTIILIIIKFALSSFLAVKIYKRKKETGKFTYGFVFGVFVFISSMLVSRVLFLYFDFYLTRFNPSTYHEMPNLLVWKVAMYIYTIGGSVFVYIIDKKIFDYKFKGILSYLLLILGTIQLLYPVNTAEDFQIISILDVRFLIIGIVLPLYFFYLAWSPSPNRILCITIATGIIFYMLGAAITIEYVMTQLTSTFGREIRITIYFISLILKVLGLFLCVHSMISFASKFSQS